MHVLSLPPAFVLSQDQTLKLKRPQAPKDPAVLDRRTSAHLIPWPKPRDERHPFDMLQSSRKRTEARQTVKLTPGSSAPRKKPNRVDYARSPSVETKPDRPHISSSVSSSSKSQRPKRNRCAFPLARPPHPASMSRDQKLQLPAAGEALSRDTPTESQAEKDRGTRFCFGAQNPAARISAAARRTAAWRSGEAGWVERRPPPPARAGRVKTWAPRSGS